MLPYSRTQELEADYLGLILMAQSGYDPQAAITFWDKFRKLSQVGRGSANSSRPTRTATTVLKN